MNSQQLNALNNARPNVKPRGFLNCSSQVKVQSRNIVADSLRGRVIGGSR